MGIEEILIESLHLDDKTKEILKNGGYKTVSDLAAAKKEDVEKLLASISFYGYSKFYEFRRLKTLLHRDFGVTFLGEYDDMGLTPDIANTLVIELELPTAVKNVLTKHLSVYTLGDLLTTDYERIVKARNMGEAKLRALKEYVHKLGYTLKNETTTLKEKRNALREKGVRLIEDAIPNDRLYIPLYRNGIFTIEDLLNSGPELDNLVGFGPSRREELSEAMKVLGLSFSASPVASNQKPEGPVENPKPVGSITEAIIAQAKLENAAIRIRIEQKEGLVAEYERLMEERKQLIQREKELDQLIEAKANGMKEGISYGRK